MAGGYAIATDAAGKLLTADAPAHAGDIVVIYLTGLGRTSPNPAMGEIPSYAASMWLRFAESDVERDGGGPDAD